MFNGKRKAGLKKESGPKGNWLHWLSVLSSILGIIGFAFTLYIYFNDLRPILSEEQLNRQNKNLVSHNKELLLDIEESENELSSLKKQINVSSEQLASSEKEIEQTKQKLVEANKKVILTDVSGQIELKYLSAVREGEDADAINIKQMALDLLKEVDTQGEYEKEGLSEAIKFVETHTKPDSMYSSIRHYENTEELAAWQEMMDAMEKQVN